MGKNMFLVNFRKIQRALSLKAGREFGCDIVACAIYDLIFDDRGIMPRRPGVESS